MKRIKQKFIKICIYLGGLVVLWAIIRLFFVSPILSDTNFSRAYYDRNGNLLRITLSTDDKFRIYTPLHEISPHIINAVILYEDKHFYRHFGINPVSLIRATRQYLSHTSHPVGASTITMQVARLVYDINSKTFSGKLKQIAAAIYLDLFHSKSEILEAYFNLAPYGANIEGIGAAARIYFNKPAKNLTKIESITLATVPQNPTKRGLNTTSGIKNIEQMRTDLVRRWTQNNPNDTSLITLTKMPLQAQSLSALPFFAPHFTDNLNTHKFTAHKSEIQTTLDLKLQQQMEKTLRQEIAARKKLGVKNAAAILLNYKTMQVLAYIGSADYFNREIYGENDGVRARRSPGSTLKPLIYATAADYGLIHGFSLLRDTPISFGVYAPENSDNEFFGPVLARDALTHSRNIPAINLLRQIGTKNFYTLLQQSGVNNLQSPDHYGVSVALGGAEVSMLELADIYATMANLGTRRKIKFETSEQDVRLASLLSPEAFFLTLDMLAHQTKPTHKIPFAHNSPTNLRHYWKTGTSSSYRDAWTAGIFGDMVLIVWVGNFDGTPNNAFSGVRAAAPIYFSLARTVESYMAANGTPMQNNNFLRDDMNIVEIEMCEIGGNIANDYCPKKTKSYFIPGKSPIAQNTIHRAIALDNKTGKRACTTGAPDTHLETFEFWDGEYLDMFRRAGIQRKTPPPFLPECDINNRPDDTAPPLIVSPMQDSKIVITSDTDFEQIGFIAFGADTDTKLIWFLDDVALGTTKNGDTLPYRVSMGDHILRVSDTNGGATTIKFSVIGG